MMEALPRCRTFSIIANLTELESFILHDPNIQRLYQQFLAFEYPTSTKPQHILFYANMAYLANNSNCSPHQAEYFRAELYMAYERYFLEQSEMLLDIPYEKLEQVRRNVSKSLCLVAFKPAIKAVVKDLIFIHLDSFLSSAIFKEYKDSHLASYDLSDVQEDNVQDKESILKLRRFFGEKDFQEKQLLGDQPKHVKQHKLSKIFGERVGVDKSALLEREQEASTDSSKRRRRDRRLHVFFGNNFKVEETLFSERVRSHSFSSFSELCEFRKQPKHVNSFRLAKFFGARPPVVPDGKLQSKSSIGSDDSTAPRHHSKAQHLMRFFGERIDPVKEATHASFATQPEHVKGCTLKKIFGESAAHTINFDFGTWPRANRNVKSRAKLEKIFGPFEA